MKNDVIQHWHDQSLYDLQTAQAMQKSGRYVYVVFCCQQAIEKALKATIINKTGELAPRTHSLSRLAELAQLDLDEEQADFIAELSVDYMRTRYPDQMKKLSNYYTKELAESVLGQTFRMTKCLLSMIK